jgi:hypothetical protein
MISKNLIVGLSIFIICIYTSAKAQDDRLSSSNISKVGTSVAQFLKIGVSARTIAMGEAFVAVANDVSAIHTNPAGLARIYANEAMFTHTNWIAQTNFEFGAFALNLGTFGTLGFMVQSFSSGDMAVRTVEEPDGTGEFFHVQNLAGAISYARNLTEQFSIGINVKYIHEEIWHMSANAFAVDVGTLFHTPFWGIVLGASITNFGTSMQLSGRDIKFAHDPDPLNNGNVSVVNAEHEMLSYSLPLRFQVGLAKDLVQSEYNRLTIAIDALHPNDNFESVNVGAEYGWKELIFLRAGYKSLFLADTEEGLTLGFGANIRISGTFSIKADYAYADFGRLENAQRFSLAVRF